MDILISLFGMFMLIAIAVLFSTNRRAIDPRTVIGAFFLQFGIGALVLFVPWGQKALLTASQAVNHVIEYGYKGIEFLFGGLVSDKMFDLFGGGGFVFALRVLPQVVFFSSLVAVLYYLRIMQVFIRLIGGALHKTLGTSRAESMSAAASIEGGLADAPLVIKPFIKDMTESELFAIMCCSLASIAISILPGYAALGVPLPYLIAAAFMAAPGGLLFAKLLIPETGKPDSNVRMPRHFTDENEDIPTNVIDAAAIGATTGMRMAMNIGAMLLAIIALVALLNAIIGGIGGWFGHGELSLEKCFALLFSPIAWLIGVSADNIRTAAQFLGQKIVINEFYAYTQYIEYLKDAANPTLSAKTQAIIVFALCGFANFGSVAILIGGLSIMAPSRRGDVARLGLRALFAGTLSNLMSATIVGCLIGLGGAAALGIGG